MVVVHCLNRQKKRDRFCSYLAFCVYKVSFLEFKFKNAFCSSILNRYSVYVTPRTCIVFFVNAIIICSTVNQFYF